MTAALTAEELDALPILSVVLQDKEVLWAKYDSNAWYEPGIEQPRTSQQLLRHSRPGLLRVLWRPDGASL